MKYVSLTGQMRSGTTLLGDIFRNQEKTTFLIDQVRIGTARDMAFKGVQPGYDENLPLIKRLRWFVALLNVTLWFAKTNKKAAFDRVLPFRQYVRRLSYNTKRGWFVREADVIDLPGFRTGYDLFKVFLDHHAYHKHGRCDLVGNKATRSEGFVHKSLQNGIHGVFIIRDPRAVIVSLDKISRERSNFGVSNTVDEMIELWLNSYTVYKDSTFFLPLRYEDLVSDPEKECQRISDYLDLEIRSDVDIVVSNSSFGDVEKGRIDSKTIDRWREMGNPKIVGMVNERLSDEIKDLGYTI